MRVLVACEFSGIVREAFASLGHDAWSCDLQPTDKPSPNHIVGDVLDVLDRGWDLMIAHPPCTYLANSGSKHLYNPDGSLNQSRFANIKLDAALFNALLGAPIPRICVENPVHHWAAKAQIPTPYAQIIQPWMFGDEATKTTYLWLKQLPPLQPTAIVGRGARHITKGGKSLPVCYNLPPGPNRQRIRSTTFQGIADAMAQQWGANS